MHCDEFWTWTREKSILNKRDIYSKYSEAGEPYFLPWRWGAFIGHSLRYSWQSNKKIALESFFWWSWCLWSKFAAKSSWFWLPLLLNLNWNAFFVGLAIFSTKTSWFARNQYGKTAIKCNLMKSDEKIKTFQIIPVACLGHSIENLRHRTNKKVFIIRNEQKVVVNNRIPMQTPLNTIERHTKENLLRQRTHMKLWLLFICIDQRESILRFPFAWYRRRVSLFDNESFGKGKESFYCFGVNFPYMGCKLFAFAVVQVTYGVYPSSHRQLK